MIGIEDVLRFWFVESGPDDWFTASPVFDDKIRERFAATCEAVAVGRLDWWRETARGCVALCLLFDQFPRNLFRGTAKAFATDERARTVARHALECGFDLAVPEDHRLFLYLPFGHSEVIEDQLLCIQLFRQRTTNPGWLDYAERHRTIIERFGRFPHRNAALGRVNTPEESEFLQQPGSSF